MDLQQLETFLAVAEERSFSRAAQRLLRTQPAVSQVIRKLEDELGESLFERTSRDGSLTAAGEVLRAYAERMVGLRAEAASAVRELKTLERGQLTLAANEYTTLYLLPLLDRFRHISPHISLAVQRSLASRIPDDLLARRAELGVLSFRPDPEQFRSIVVYSDAVAFVVHAGHPLAGRRRAHLRELGAQNFVAHNVASPLRRQIVATFAEHKTPLNIGVELPSLEAMKRFVAMGNGVAFVPELAAAREIELGELVKVPIAEVKMERQLRLVHRRAGTLSHSAVAFLQAVRAFSMERGRPYLYAVEADSSA
ncbi:MAG TPA: LysR family transcriptional regulator [Acidobacteriaceae bacterium]|jgi:DNA-binding transcriptional LysR family regulator|nr:LysR family transcriptional regulator [Acidobacteriaceae bacterium]